MKKNRRLWPNKLYSVRWFFLVCFINVSELGFAEEEVKPRQCSATRDFAYNAAPHYVKLTSQRSAKKTGGKKCTIAAETLMKSGVLASWPIYDLRSKAQYLQEHIKGSKHLFQSELLSFTRTGGKRLLYLPRENAAFDRLCAEIAEGNLGVTRIIDERKPKLITMGVEYLSQNSIKASFAYLTAMEFVPQLINSRWVFYDLSKNSVENRHLLKQYNISYRQTPASDQDLIDILESEIAKQGSKELVFLLSKAQMNIVSNAKLAAHFRGAWYVDTTESSVSYALEQSLIALNYKLAPKPLPKCYRE